MSRQKTKDRKTRREAKRFENRSARRITGQHVIPVIQDFEIRATGKRFEPITIPQAHMQQFIEEKRCTLAVGAAGTGKTHVALALAAEALMAGEIERIIVIRPLIDAEEDRVGTLPGEMDEKIAPYFQPARDLLNECLGVGHVNGLEKAGRIVFAPLAFLRGSTFKNCRIIIDEAQNCTVKQFKLMLTRMGRGCKLIACGDTAQSDLPDGVESGLLDAAFRFRKDRQFGIQEFFSEDCVRDPFVRNVIEGYEGKVSKSIFEGR